jgi:retinol dehydrogenase-12
VSSIENRIDPWSIHGKTCVITGASSGIGRETARSLGLMGAKLVLVGRSLAKHREVLDELDSESIESELIETELGDLRSVASTASQLEQRHPEVSMLINNAGQGGRKGITADGFELAFGVNYLSHYLLTRRLLRNLIRNSPARIVNLSSNGHLRIESFDPADGLGKTRSLTGFREYYHSKAAMVAFARELAARLDPNQVKAIAVHPGVAATDGWRAIPQPFRWYFTKRMMSPAQGALTVVRAAIDPDVKSGIYLTPEGQRPVHPLIADDVVTRLLWEQSERWVASYL